MSSATSQTHPNAITDFSSLKQQLYKPLAVFLDYDGTLAPIVNNPAEAELTPGISAVLQEMAKHVPVIILSGRDRTDVQNRMALPELWYAGSHGFDIISPQGEQYEQPQAKNFLPSLKQLGEELTDQMHRFSGVLVERKRYAIAVHTRCAKPEDEAQIHSAITKSLQPFNDLTLQSGKKIDEIKPNIDWHKGKALVWILDRLPGSRHTALYMGDDTTDEDVFKTLLEQKAGVGIAVREDDRPTVAEFTLHSTDEVLTFLEKLNGDLERSETAASE